MKENQKLMVICNDESTKGRRDSKGMQAPLLGSLPDLLSAKGRRDSKGINDRLKELREQYKNFGYTKQEKISVLKLIVSSF